MSRAAQKRQKEEDVFRFVEVAHRLAQSQDAATLIYSRSLPSPSDGYSSSASELASHIDHYSASIARRIEVVMKELTHLAQPETQGLLTPRTALLELTRIVRSALTQSIAGAVAASPQVQNGEAAVDANGDFNLLVSSRTVPVDAVLEGLYTLAYVSTKLRMELVMLQLQHRLRGELSSAIEPDAAAALMVTETLLEDIDEIYHNILVTMPQLKTSPTWQRSLQAQRHSLLPGETGRDRGQQLLTREEAAPVMAALSRYYYLLGDWVLLTESSTTVPPVSLTRVTHLAHDDETGEVIVHFSRATTDTPWGLLFNEKGRMVDVDVPIRCVREMARSLHSLLMCSTDGAHVTHVNETPVRPVSGAGASRAALHAIQVASEKRRTLKLTLAANEFKSSRRDVPVMMSFFMADQGGEGSAGQRCTIVMHRRHAGTLLQFNIDAALNWYAPPARLLSPYAGAFVKRFHGRLRVVTVNGIAAVSAEQVVGVVTGAETVKLELVVTPRAVEPAPGLRSIQVSSNAAREVPTANSSAGMTAAGATSREMNLGRSETLHSTAPAKAPTGIPVHPDEVARIEREVREATERELSAAAQASMVGVDEPLLPPSDAVGKRAKMKKTLISQIEESAPAPTESSATAAPAAMTEKEPAQLEDALPLVALDAAVQDAFKHLDAPEGEAPLCVFSNGVSVTDFNGSHITFERPSVQAPWELRVAQKKSTPPNGFPLSLIQLPPYAKSAEQNAFIQEFAKAGRGWTIESVNGKSAKGKDGVKLLMDMAKLTRMSMKVLKK